MLLEDDDGDKNEPIANVGRVDHALSAFPAFLWFWEVKHIALLLLSF
jgi:hypothetical protein